MILKKAMKDAGKDVPTEMVVISARGKVLNRESERIPRSLLRG
jgi:hypothetical protein